MARMVGDIPDGSPVPIGYVGRVEQRLLNSSDTSRKYVTKQFRAGVATTLEHGLNRVPRGYAVVGYMRQGAPTVINPPYYTPQDRSAWNDKVIVLRSIDDAEYTLEVL